MSVDALFAEWLQADCLWKVIEDPARIARWGESAITTQRMSALAAKEDATDEGERQLTFLGGPIVVDEHLLPGEWRHRLGQVITISGEQLGYEEGIDVFLIEAQDNLATGLSSVAVLRRL